MKRRSANQLWRELVRFVMESHDESRRAIRRALDLPAGRVRVLRRLDQGPRTLRELAELTGSDAPATTVTVNDLEARGLVRREVDRDDRRAKRVSLTDAGRDALTRALQMLDAAPAGFAEVPAADLAALGRILDTLAAGRDGDDE